MRVPRRHVYRAFPELDAYTDEQCERLMRRVRMHASAQANIIVSVLLAILVGVVVGLMLGAWLGRRVLPPVDPRADMLFLLPPLVGALGTPAALALMVRDALLRRSLVKAIRLRLERVRCPACHYLLIGQRASSGRVTCPECGATATLRQLGLTKEDLVPPTADTDPLDRL